MDTSPTIDSTYVIKKLSSNQMRFYKSYLDKLLVRERRKAAANEELPHQHLDNSTLPFQINPYQSGEPYEAVKQFVAGGLDHAALLKKMEVLF